MSRKTKRLTVLTMAFMASTMLPASLVFAQSTSTPTDAGVSNAGKLDEKTRGANFRASQVMGLNIQNSQGESVGEIKDLVIDGKTGKVRYAAVTYGGLFGLGNKLFAVPFEAFKVTADPDDPDDSDDFVMVLDVTQKQLEGAQGFDQDHWPNMADQNMLRELDKRYGVNRPIRNRANRSNLNIDVNREGVDVDVDRE